MTTLRHALVLIGATLCLVAGTLLLPLPTPVGLPLLVVGMALALSASATARRALRSLRRRHGGIDTTLHRIEPRLPGFIRRAIRVTRPWKPKPPQGAARSDPPDGRDGTVPS